MRRILTLAICLAFITASPAFAEKTAAASQPETVRIAMETSMGTMILELYPDKAPETVQNFLSYASTGFYNGTIFHRVIHGFMVQGGGFTENMQQKPTQDPIANEAANGLKNQKGTIAMARTNAPHSATSQFFINTVDNEFLNYKASTAQGFGYCVFGRVVEGMDVLSRIERVTTGLSKGHQNVPREAIKILSVKKLP
ncbi:peptidylprolyl isomerase [Desulfobotulus pelophilus]|uniref:peptidylprolyl isomerase n=1 Tax=Desulfobotulus pelophilus TaxID=2823377 RepID=UPI0026E56FE0|nr:peptidylprolyl isomerase [Desulfobotulus pelophilus]